MDSQAKSRCLSGDARLQAAALAGILLLSLTGLAAPPDLDAAQNATVDETATGTPDVHKVLDGTPNAQVASDANGKPKETKPTGQAVAPDPIEFDEKSTVNEAFFEGATDSTNLADLLTSFARTMFMLLVVIALVYLFLHKGLGKLIAKSRVGKRIQVLEKTGLDQRRSLYLVQVDDKQFLLGGSDGGVTHIANMGGTSNGADYENPPADFSGSLLAVQRKKQGRSVPAALVNPEQVDVVDDDGRPN